MAEKRLQVREDIRLTKFMPPGEPILVACEKCGECASLRNLVYPRTGKSVQQNGECSCLHCGHQWSVAVGPRFFTAGPLWLKMPCRKNVLWILNRPHLDFLEEFIAAELREERMPGLSSRRMSAALPRWMLAAKGREDVVHCLAKLREKLDKTKLS